MDMHGHAAVKRQCRCNSVNIQVAQTSILEANDHFTCTVKILGRVLADVSCVVSKQQDWVSVFKGRLDKEGELSEICKGGGMWLCLQHLLYTY